MSRVLLRSAAPVTLVGGGPVAPRQLAAALEIAPVVVAADGGGDVALPAGFAFAAVIGDLDSLRDPGALRARGVPVHHIAEQDSTDLEKCLYSVEAPLLVGLGFLGGRIDHQLSAMNALVRHGGRPILLAGEEDVCFHCPRVFEIDAPPGLRVSLFPMRAVVGRVSEGLRWSVEGLAMAPDRRVGTSNIALGGRVRVGFDGPGALVILPAEMLQAAAARLAR